MARVRLKHQALAKRLKRKPISQNRWAQILGLSSAHLSMLVNGKRAYPDAETRAKLMDRLSASFEDLFEVEEHSGPAVPAHDNSGHGRPWDGLVSSPGSQGKALFMSSLLQDVRFALRGWARRPGFVGAALLVLALGIGANTAIFSLVSAVLLRPLPFPQPDAIAEVSNHSPGAGLAVGLSEGEFHLYQGRQNLLSAFAAFRLRAVNLNDGDQPRRVTVVEATPEFFKVLKMEAAQGQVFRPGMDGSVDEQVVVLTYPFWQAALAGDPSVVGEEVQLDERVFEVIGVLPEEFEATGLAAQAVRPLVIRPENLEANDFHNHNLTAWGRLPENGATGPTEDALDAMMEGLRQDFPGDFEKGKSHSTLLLTPLLESMVGPVKPALVLMLGAVAVVLLIACANVAHLFLTRARGRRREFALRTALGAGQGRLTRQLLSECLLLALLAGGAGLMLSFWAVDLLLAVAPSLPRMQQASPGWGVLAFNLLVSLAAGLLFGSAPVFSLRSGRWAADLAGGGRIAEQSGTRGWSGGRLLAASETALSLVLLLAAFLLLASLGRLLGVDPGFSHQDVMAGELSLPESRYPDDDQTRTFADRLLREVRSLPGVEEAALSFRLPLTGSNNWGFEIEGRTQEELRFAQYNLVSSSYFETLGIPLLAGRSFAGESVPSRPSVIISRSTAERLWPGESPLGRRLNVNIEKQVWREIVGVVGDVRSVSLAGDEEFQIYFPLQRLSFASPNNLWLSVRAGEGAVSATSLRDVLWRLDPSLPLTAPQRLETLVESQLKRPRFLAWLLSFFALTALVMAATGIYGVMSHRVEQRKREFGVRLALGARRSNVALMVLRETAATSGLGILTGLFLSVLLSRILAGLLYGISPTDGILYAVVATGLFIFSLASSWVPCLRAIRVDPARSLRAQ